MKSASLQAVQASAGQVRVVRRDGVAWVSLSHPARFNAMTRAMWCGLREAFEGFRDAHDLKAVVLQGEGAHFCAGGDISEYPGFRFEEASLRHFHEQEVWGGLQAVLDCEWPVLARIEGHCMGAGVEIASCCDVRLASSQARFGAPIARLGFPMAPREAALVSRALGETVARDMLLSASIYSAADLVSRGFLTEVVEPGELDAACAQRLQRLQSLSPMAARLNKRTLRALAVGVAPDALIGRAYDYAGACEHREGVEAFLAKRPPRF